MLDLDRVAGRKREPGKQAVDPVAEAQPSLGRELMEQRRDHQLADRPDLEQRVVGDRRARIGIGEAEVEHGRKAVGDGHPERHPGKAEIAQVLLAIGADRAERRGEIGARLGERGQAQLAAEHGAERAARESAPASNAWKKLLRGLIEGRGRESSKPQALQLWPL